MMQDLLAMEDKKTHKLGSHLKVNFGALVWDTGVRPSYQAVILPGTLCSAILFYKLLSVVFAFGFSLFLSNNSNFES